MRAFALTCEALAHLDSVEGKVQCAAAYLTSRAPDEVGVAARFLAGTPLPPNVSAPNVGAASIARVVAERAGVPEESVRRRAVASGDLGLAVASLLEDAPPAAGTGLRLVDVAEVVAALGPLSAGARTRKLRRLFENADPLEAKYLTKLLVGSMRTGMQAGRVEDAIALAFRRPVDDVRRAHMLLGEIGLAAERAQAGDLDRTRLRTFRPVRCMLAHTASDAPDVLQHMPPPLFAEPKFDGIRAQLHRDGKQHRVFSRSLDDITHWFPELGAAIEELDSDWILDGEIVAWKDGPLPFEQLQQRMGRRQVPLTMLLDVPVIYIAFDALRSGGRDLIDEPVSERKRILREIGEEGVVRAIEHRTLREEADVADFLEEALGAGHEGVVFKSPTSTYQPGRRGRAWLKLKRPFGTLDVVVTAAQYGSGKRAGWLSDLTFAVRGDGEDLLDVGKAYSGLTDEEIRSLTDHFKSTVTRRAGELLEVQPEVVLEVAFDGIQRSLRHAGGFALRFPRIVRRRADLGLDDVDTLRRVEQLFEEQRRRVTSRRP